MLKRTGATATAALVGALALSTAAGATTVTLVAAMDNTLYEKSDGTLSNGAGDHVFAGRTGQGPDDDQRRAVIAFDVAAAVPTGAVIEDVTLTLFMSRTVASIKTVSLRRLLADWGEGNSNAGGNEGGGDSAATGDATWLHRFYPSILWTSAGGDYQGGTAAASTVVGGNGFYDWSSPTMVAHVQQWLNNPSSNFGWILIGDETSSQTAKRFDSRQNSNASRRPKLEIVYTLPGACCFGDGTCEVLGAGACALTGGGYLGDGTDCEPNPCAQPVGACCFVNGTCAVSTSSSCAAASGTYQGNGTSCTPNPCPQPTGACCYAEGTCIVQTSAACATAGGTYQGTFTGCAPNPCPQPAGACCYGNGTCAVTTSGACTAGGGTWQGEDVECSFDLCPVALTPWLDALPIPAVALPNTGQPGGEAEYEIAMQEVSQQLHAQLPATRVWGYAGSFPGPTIEATTGLPVTVNWVNDLRDAQGNLRTTHYLDVDLCPHGAEDAAKTVVHLHGGHVPSAIDGYPEATYLPGGSALYEYPNNQLPATLWYHDHALGITRLNVYMGLAGFYIVRDAFENALGLPAGEFEIPIAIQDRSFNGDGTLRYPSMWMDMFFGHHPVVNGKVSPYLNVKAGKYRFRFLNGCTTRTLLLTLSNGAPITQIGAEGGLLPAPVTVSALDLAPAERADVIIDFAAYPPGTEIILLNGEPAPKPIAEVMKFVVVAGTGFNGPIPPALRPLDELSEGDADLTRDLELRRSNEPCAGTIWLINGMHWDHIMEFPKLDDIEIWRFVNRSGQMHPMHMHLVMFQVLDRQDFVIVDGAVVPVGVPVAPPLQEQGWKDTVQAEPNQITRVIARFDDYLGKYPYHCHILEHEDHEMMRQFETEPPCAGDADATGDVGFGDLTGLLVNWGACPAEHWIACPWDLDDNGDVGFADLTLLLIGWGPCG